MTLYTSYFSRSCVFKCVWIPSVHVVAWGVCSAVTGCENASFPRFSLLFSLPPEGLKKVRNPDRMYRSAVCYAGHGPPKSISDDTETNSKSQLLILHCCSERPLAGQSIIHSSIHLFTSWFHPFPPCPTPPHLHPLPSFLLLQHNTSCGLLCWLKCLLYGITLSIAEVLSLTKSDCFRLRPGDQDLSRPSERKLTFWAINYGLCTCLFAAYSLTCVWWRGKKSIKVNNTASSCKIKFSMIWSSREKVVSYEIFPSQCINLCLFLPPITFLLYESSRRGPRNKDNTTS